MLELDAGQIDLLRIAVREASVREDVHRAVHDLYHQLEVEVQRRRPMCAASGRCCKFEEFGHRLFITTIELATFAHDLGQGLLGDETAENWAKWKSGGCPFQLAGLCGVHLIRPFGCRIFFCDSTALNWQEMLYERFHGQFKSLHERFSVPYFYVEWRQGLAALDGPAPGVWKR